MSYQDKVLQIKQVVFRYLSLFEIAILDSLLVCFNGETIFFVILRYFETIYSARNFLS